MAKGIQTHTPAACPRGSFKYSVSNEEMCVQAPYDNSTYCLTNPRFREEHQFPSNIKLHFDSHHYQSLIESNSVWKKKDCDGDGREVRISNGHISCHVDISV